MRLHIRIIGSCILILCTYWLFGTDPVRRDAKAYFQRVVHPVRGALQDIHQVDNEDATPTVALVEERLLPAYRRVLSKARDFKPRSPDIARIHNKMVHIYTAAVRESERYVASVHAGDTAGVLSAQKALWALDFGGLERDLERLSELVK